MDRLRTELSNIFPNTFEYNNQGDPESVFFMLNNVLREIIGKNTAIFDSMLIELGSVLDKSHHITESSSTPKREKKFLSEFRKSQVKIKFSQPILEIKSSLFFKVIKNDTFKQVNIII